MRIWTGLGFELLEVTKEVTSSNVLLSFRYSLRNNYPIGFQIPTKISHLADLDCRGDKDFDKDKSGRAYSHRVVDLQTNQEMYGYGDDHHVLFEPNEKEFRVLFEPFEIDFDTFDRVLYEAG
jgi:hypothetical protein